MTVHTAQGGQKSPIPRCSLAEDSSNPIDVAICAYDSEFAIGGPLTWLQRMCPELLLLGFRVKIHIFWWNDLEKGRVHAFACRAGIPFAAHRMAATETTAHSFLAAISENPPEIAIVDNVIPALLCRRYLHEAGVRTVAILRSDDDFYRGIISHLAAGDEQSQVSAVVCVSQFLRELYETATPGRKVCVIPSGTPAHAFPERKRPSERWRIVYVGRLTEEQKRIYATLRALIDVCREVPHVEAIIYGDGPERNRLNELISKTDSRIEVKGFVSPEEMPSELRNAHILLLLSEYEGTPTAVMEAMASGVVPICRRIRSGIPELVIHDKTGLLVDSEDPVAIVNCVRQLTGHPDLWERLSANAANHVANGFSTTCSARKWCDLLRSLKPAVRPVSFIVPFSLHLPATHRGFAHQDRRLSDDGPIVLDPRPKTLSGRIISSLRRAYRRARRWVSHPNHRSSQSGNTR